MNSTQRRIALLTGASLATLGFVTPAFAAPHDAATVTPLPPVNSTADTVTICDLATTPPNSVPDSPCFYGDYATGTAAAVAVTAFPVMQHQTGASVTLTLVNDGSAEVGAVAIASNTEGGATAGATLNGGIRQTGNATTGSANLRIENNGPLLIDAFASAVAGTAAVAGAGDATAKAVAVNGISQAAHGVTGAAAVISNNDLLVINAVANASAPDTGTANATATLGAIAAYGIHQVAVAGAGNATASLTNNGTITVAASAHAVGGVANASATLTYNGIGQTATAAGADNVASAVIHNQGALNLGAVGKATASVGAAYGFAEAYQAITQHANGNGGADATALLASTGTLNIFASAAASASNGHATASAYNDYGIQQFVKTVGGGDANAEIDLNGASITAAANANAGVGAATATASVSSAIGQNVNANGGDASALITNVGDVAIAASANAIAAGAASANATVDSAIHQIAKATGGDAFVTLLNGGTIDIGAIAHATGDASAFANVDHGIFQSASATAPAVSEGAIVALALSAGPDAVASLSNTGTMVVHATAVASDTVGGPATATAHVTSAIQQNAHSVGGNASGSLTNHGVVVVSASAFAAGDTAVAHATADGLLSQDITAPTGSATAALINFGTGVLAATASASGATRGTATAVAGGMTAAGEVTGAALYQHVTGATVSAFLANAGSTMLATANATAAGSESANASAVAVGVGQVVNGGTGSATILNVGFVTVGAHASASASSSADATARGVGVSQRVSTPVAMNFSNGGVISVDAAAFASASAGDATATAIGYAGTLTGLGVGVASISNSGTMNVTATAVAPDNANAHAQGIVLQNAAGQPLVASVANSGTINVLAQASGGGTFTTPGATEGAPVVVVNQSHATATGIRVNAGLLGATTTTTPAGGTPVVTHYNSTITNSGTIDVTAMTGNGGPANAYGILVTGNGAAVPAAGQVLTINNSGDITALFSTDGGATMHRGEAIDVSAAPVVNTVINLLGGGNITGNIELKSDADVINVRGGKTVFNGIVNSGCLPAGGVALDVAAQNDCGVGTVNINNGGNLELAIDDTDGPSYVFANTLDMRAPAGGTPGTITFDLPAATGGTAAVGTYPQVIVDTAFLDGTLVANIAAPNGLYETTTYENVIDALTGQRNGAFDQCIINGIPTDSLLLGITCVNDNAGNVDLAIVRQQFNAPGGLNLNGLAVASGLNSFYNLNLTGGAASLFAELFQFTDTTAYNIALNQLSGSVYANYLDSFPSLGVHQNDLTDHATNCEIPALAGSVLECRASAPIHVWGQLDFQTRKADGDIEAGDTRSKRFTGLLGVDANVGGTTIIGIDGGYLSNHFRDFQFGDNIRGNGWTGGVYAVFDPGAFFVKGVTTYSKLNGDSQRYVNFTQLANGVLAYSARPIGDPDVTMWTAGLHGGARFSMGAASVVTPYLNYDYVHAKLEGFDEVAGNGAELTVEGGHSNHSFLTGGVKWATQLGAVVPEVNLGYRYRFGDSRSSFHGWFTPDPENDFDVVSASHKKGTLLAGISFGGKLGPVDVRLGYEGEFNGDVTSHSGNFKLVLPLGGHAAPPPPPPPPAPVMAPPPPPPAPPPPPPPPAPVERGERGQ